MVVHATWRLQNLAHLAKHFNVVRGLQRPRLLPFLLVTHIGSHCWAVVAMQYAVEWIGVGRSDRPDFPFKDVR